MPKEQIRKRGKRKPKATEQPRQEQDVSQPSFTEAPTAEAAPTAGPSGIHPARAAMLSGRPLPARDIQTSTESQGVEDHAGVEGTLEWQRTPQVDSDYPFGVLDPDLKAYFKIVEDQIRDWEGTSSLGEEREDRQTFLSSVLAELRGHELLVATDPDTAVVLERLLPSMGDWGRRVIGDAFGDSWEGLIRHRFGSHVAQTWFTLAADTLDREVRGEYPPQHHAQTKDTAQEGTLPTMTTLFQTILTSLQPNLPSLLTNPHASPPLRLLLLVMSPNKLLPSLDAVGGESSLIRSKKSLKYRKGHGVQGKSIFGDENGREKGKGKDTAGGAIDRRVSDELVELRKAVRRELMERVGGAEWRGMGVDAVGCAAVQLLLEPEIDDSASSQPGSLLDHLTEGFISNPSTTAQPYPTSLLSTVTGTRLFETILRISPLETFLQIWQIYFIGKTGKLATHPYANFVVAAGVSRLDPSGVEGVVRECRSVSGGRALIKTARTSVLQALVARCGELDACQEQLIQLIISALQLPDNETNPLVPCLMALKTYPMYQSLLTGTEPPVDIDAAETPTDEMDKEAEEAAAAQARFEGWKNRRLPKDDSALLGPNMQGCLLLQGLVGLRVGNEVVLESLLAQPIDILLTYAKSPIASHLLDSTLTHTSVPPKYKKRLMNAFMGRYKDLAEDRMGSRVCDTVWKVGDGYIKEKIARSLISSSTTLGSSQYGRFFARKLQLHLLECRPEEWRSVVLGMTGRGTRLPVSVPVPEAMALIGNNRGFMGGQVGRLNAGAGVGDVGHGDEDLTGGKEGEGGREKRGGNERNGGREEDEIDVLFSGVEKKRRKA